MQQPEVPDLSHTEWMAVSVALSDAAELDCAPPPPPGSFRARFARIGTMMTGRHPAPPLANPRLEAVRQFVCMKKRKSNEAEQLVPELLQLGFSEAQVRALALLSH